jgi:hypothetical protein
MTCDAYGVRLVHGVKDSTARHRLDPRFDPSQPPRLHPCRHETVRAVMTVPRLLRRPLLPPVALTGVLTGALVLTSVATVGPLPGTGHQAPHPVKSSRVLVAPARAALDHLGGGALARGTRSGAVTAPQQVHRNLAVVGATWARGALASSDVVQVRMHRDGSWGPWQAMDRDDDHAPDTDGPGGAEGRAARQGTTPYVVDGDQAQVRVLSAAAVPPAVQVSVIDPGTSPADDTVGTAVPGSAAASAARPTILTRKDWGADESMRKGSVGYGQAHIAFVHHTDGTNSYTSAQVPAIIRGIYDYHVNGQGWNDIGYNFLVDRFGRIWEGRYGGVDKAVIGAHTMNYNSWSFGVAAIGTFTSAKPTAAMVTGIEKTIAWKFSIHGDPPTGTVYARDKYFNRISGHRDGYPTSCPGQALYNLLPSIRTAVTKMMGTMRRSGISRSVDSGGTPDLLSYPGSLDPGTMTGPGSVLRSASTMPVSASVRIGAGWSALRNITLTPDFTGDGKPDIIASDPKANGLRIYSGTGTGGFAGVAVRGGGWNVMTRLVAAGDRTGDGRADLLAVRNDGALVLYPGDGRGWVTAGSIIATGFGAMSSVVNAGDVNHDGRADLFAVRASDGALLLYPGTAGGGVGSPVTWGGGWNSLTNLAAGPDLDGDGRQGDLFVRQSNGVMRSYYVDEAGKLTRANFWGAGWNALDNLSSGADWNGDGHPDLVARVTSTGDLRLYAGTGQRDFSPAPLALHTDLADMNLMRVVGDIDGDGIADAIGRTSTGDLYALKGRGDGSFVTQPTLIGRGWGVFNLIEAIGDFSNDGIPDVIARTSSGELRMYVMTRSMTFGWWIQLGLGWQGMRSVIGAGAVNGDYNGDVVALRDSDGAVLLYRGSGPGTLNSGTNDVVVALTGQNDLARLIGVGDFNGDSKNDLMAEDTNGKLWLYPGDGTQGFSKSRQPVRANVAVGDVLG